MIYGAEAEEEMKRREEAALLEEGEGTMCAYGNQEGEENGLGGKRGYVRAPAARGGHGIITNCLHPLCRVSLGPFLSATGLSSRCLSSTASLPIMRHYEYSINLMR